MKRRILLTSSGLTAAFLVAGCSVFSVPPSGDRFAQAKAYLDAAVPAVLAGAQQYLIGPPVPSPAAANAVRAMMEQLITAKTAIDGTNIVLTDWKAGAGEVIALTQSLLPTVAAYLGDASPLVALALAVANAFIQALPAPPAAPPTPPAALTRKAAAYHGRH